MKHEDEKTPMKVEPKADRKAADAGPDNPSKHPTEEAANKEPHRESGGGRREPAP